MAKQLNYLTMFGFQKLYFNKQELTKVCLIIKAFVSKYPTNKHLANATEEEVLKLWQGLGYYSRARNLYSTAKFIANELNGVFPSSYQDLLN